MAGSTKVAEEGVSIVLKGSFNPVIFTAHWLKEQALIGEPEMSEYEVQIITRDIASFRAGWLSVQATTDALQLMTNAPEEFIRLRDVAVGILRKLSHTPVAVMGINRHVHVIPASPAGYHAVGDALAPKLFWKSAMRDPGMRALSVWDARPDKYAGRVEVQVEPSLRVPGAIYIATNDHFTLELAPDGNAEVDRATYAWDLTGEMAPSADKIPVATRILTEDWSDSMQRADHFVDMVMDLAKGMSE